MCEGPVEAVAEHGIGIKGEGGRTRGTTAGRWIAFPPASTCSGNAAYFSSVIRHYHEQTAKVKLSLALAGCNGKDTSKPRFAIDAGIMKEIGHDLEGGFGLGQGHSILLLLHFS